MIVDSNEPNSIINALNDAGVIVEVSQVRPAGDYIIGKYLIERKSNNDFYSSIYDRRLFTQLKYMNELTDYKPILCVHGNIPVSHKWVKGSDGKPVKSKVSQDEHDKRENTAISALTTALNSYERVSLVLLKSEEQFIKFIVDLNFRQTKKSEKPSSKREAETLDDVKYNVFCQMPGIGAKGAQTLTDSKISIAQLCELTVDQMIEVFPKMPHKVASSLYEALHYAGDIVCA